LVLGVLSFLLVAAVACSSSSPTATGDQTSPSAPAATSPPASSPASGGSDTDLSGTWSGQYGGTFTGTFKLSWTQSGSNLNGTIDLNPGGTSPLNGTVSGNSITFGTVGSQAITYTGTVSGDSMSGNYKVHTANGTVGGSWSANKTS
jgi:hypothetical protein